MTKRENDPQAICRDKHQSHERCEDQAATAVKHYDAGAQAHEQGDYATAEQHYVQAAKLHEQLNDHSGVAQCWAALGMLMAASRRDAEAVQYELPTLNILNDMHSPQATECIMRLITLRARMGAKPFATIVLERGGDEQSLQGLTALLNTFETLPPELRTRLGRPSGEPPPQAPRQRQRRWLRRD